jgi:O-acetyl-ADP-ribose deacetylase (regulator of RNase III)
MDGLCGCMPIETQVDPAIAGEQGRESAWCYAEHRPGSPCVHGVERLVGMSDSPQQKIDLFPGDICQQRVDAIVNAANNHLWMGSGVAGAIKRRGGEEIEDAAVKLGPIPVGEAVVTGAGKLPAKHVIHAAAMGQDLIPTAETIGAATRNSLLRANELGLESIAFPLLGTGVGGFDVEEAARLMLEEVRAELEGETSVKKVVFCVLPPADAVFKAVLDAMGESS